MKRKLLSITLALSVVMSFTSVFSVSAKDDISVVLDGEEISFDVPPQLINDRTMVPLRAVFEALGASVDWNADTRTVVSEKDGIRVTLTVDSPTMYVNGEPVVLDSPACIVNDRTLVPVRAISEAYNANVDWDSASQTVYIESSASEAAPAPTFDLTATPAPTLAPVPTTVPTVPPVSPNTGNTSGVVEFNEYSFYPTRTVKIECTDIIRGAEANAIIESENRFNDKPVGNQEWLIMEFDVDYISSTDGANDVLEGSDIIYKDTFFTESKSKLVVHDMATLGDLYGGYGVFDVELYPGSSGKVVIGLLIDSYNGDILLRVPKNAGDDVTWINIGNADSISSGEVIDDTTPSISQNDTTPLYDSSSSYYPGSSVPTYTSVTGMPLLRTMSLDDGTPVYVYEFDDADTVGAYWERLFLLGWNSLGEDDVSTTDTFESGFYKGNEILVVNTYFNLMEVWIVPNTI